MPDENKKCPMCAEEIPLEAAECPYCQAKFDVSIKGYCTTCHAKREADSDGRCMVCRTEVVDRRVESKFVEGIGKTIPGPAPATASTSSPAVFPSAPMPKEMHRIPQRGKTGLVLVVGGILAILCLLMILGFAIWTLKDVFSLASRTLAAPTAADLPAATAAAKSENTQILSYVERFTQTILNDVRPRAPNFEDDFSNPDDSVSGWSDLGQDVVFTDGVMRFQITNGWSQAGGSFDSTDFVLEYDITPKVFSEEVSFGVDFLIGNKRWNYLAFNPIDQWAGMGKYFNDEWMGELDGTEVSIFGQIGTTHRIELIVKDGEYAVMIDDAPILYAPDDELLEDGWCHLWLYSSPGYSELDIDNVKFWDLNNLNT